MQQPSCYGRFHEATGRTCHDECDREARFECLAYTQLLVDSEANRLEKRRQGVVPVHMKPLVRLGYPPKLVAEWAWD